MADVFTREKRSEVMSKIRSRGTKPENLVAKYLFSRGLRYRRNDKRYPGHPDLVFPKYRTVVFVHGCFWHLHEGCRYARIPEDHAAYWSEKLLKNRERDRKEQEELRAMGWKVIVVWECSLRGKDRERTLESLYDQVTGSDFQAR
jgi:DNA mismatch endonuclease (patch repair protein)